MWMRAVFATTIFCGIALGAFASSAQPLARDRPQYGYRAPLDGLNVLNIGRKTTDFARPGRNPAYPGRNPAYIVTAQITRAQAVRAAIRCNRGGEALKPPVRKGQGYVVKILKGSYVRNIRVDRNGRCR